MATEANTQSFWEHLDVLRAAIIKIVAVAVVFGIVVFLLQRTVILALYSYRRMTVLLPISCSTGWLHGQEVQWNHFPFDLLIQG